MIKENKRIFLVLFSICLVILVILVIILNNQKRQTGKPLTPYIDPKEDNVLNLSGFGVFFERYEGHLTSAKVAKKLDEITTKKLPETFDIVIKLNEEEFKNYFEKNKESIRNNFGIESVEELNTFIKKLNETGLDLKTWYRLDVLKDTFVNRSEKNNYAYVEYEVSFKNDQKIRFSLYLSKEAQLIPQYIIKVIK